jgi:hypothetical protein
MDCVRQKHSFHVNRMVPISSLPDELIAMIFEEGHRSSSFQPPDRPLEIPVSQVTRRWRKVAAQTPRLWRMIRITTSGMPCEVLAQYLLKSMPLTLNIMAEVGDRRDLGRKNVTIDYFQTLIQHVDRWGHISILSHSSSGIHRLFTWMSSITAPSLHTMHIYFMNDGPSADYVYGNSDIFKGGAPLLTTFRVRGISLQRWLPPLAALTTLHLHETFHEWNSKPTYDQMRQMLSGLPELTHLIVYGRIVKYLPAEPPANMIELGVLRSLSIRISEADFNLDRSCRLLMVVSAPLLECLVLEDITDKAFSPLCRTLEFRSGRQKFPELRALSIRPVEYNPFSITELFATLPGVTHFSIIEGDADVYLEPLVSTTPNTVPPWPDLQSLALSDFCVTEGPTAFPRRLIAATMAMRHPIRTLRLSRKFLYEDGLRPGDLEWLRKHLVLEELHSYSTADDGNYTVQWPDSDELESWVHT